MDKPSLTSATFRIQADINGVSVWAGSTVLVRPTLSSEELRYEITRIGVELVGIGAEAETALKNFNPLKGFGEPGD
jgi:hypothetical protein